MPAALLVGAPEGLEIPDLYPRARIYSDFPWDAPQSVRVAAVRHRLHPGEFAVPLTEEAVLACGEANGKGFGLSAEAALAATDRIAQRNALHPTGLNPRWCTMGAWEHGRCVVKLRTSTLSRGVLCPAEDTDGPFRLLVEQFVEGPQYGVNGIVCDPESCGALFSAVEQTWDRPGGRILSYARASDPRLNLELGRAALRAVKALGLSWCAWNVELKGSPPRVIEVHARFGEDTNPTHYWSWAGDENPIDMLASEMAKAADLDSAHGGGAYV